MTSLSRSLGPFARFSPPELRAAVLTELEAIEVALAGALPGARVELAGSFAAGEACAFLEDGRAVVLSDLDLFVRDAGPGMLLQRVGLRAKLEAALQLQLLPSVDLNLVLSGAGAATPDFVVHALHDAAQGLLRCAPGRLGDWRQERYELNRVVFTALRAAWNLDASEPVYALLDCRAPLEGAWGERLEPALRSLALDALDENPGLGIAALGPDAREQHRERWVLGRLWVERLQERWHTWLAAAPAPARLALQRERLEGLARLSVASVRGGRVPRPRWDIHKGLFEARRALGIAVCPGGIDPSWLARGLDQLSALGLGPRRWPTDAGQAWEQGRRAARMPNPLRIVIRR